MSEAHTIPPDLTDDEREAVEAFRREAISEAEERAALWVRVRRAFQRRIDRGATERAAMEAVVDEERMPVSLRTARRIVKNEGAWSVHRLDTL